MRKVWTAVSMGLLTLTFAVFICAPQGRAYSPRASLQNPQEQQQEPQTAREQMARGELVSVDADNNMLTIKTSSGEQMQFAYDSDTKVEGSDSGVQGLSTQTGSQLMIHYREGDNGRKMATRIEIVK